MQHKGCADRKRFCRLSSESELKLSELLPMVDDGASERPMEKSLPNVYPLQQSEEKTNVHGGMQKRRRVAQF